MTEAQPAKTKQRRFLRPDATWRRRIPAFALPLLIELRVFIARRVPVVRDSARLQMRFLLEKSRPDLDIDKMSKRYLRQFYWRNERRWRPHLVTSQPVDGAARFLATRDPARGTVLTFVHQANFDGAWNSLDLAGVHCHIVAAAFLFKEDNPAWVKQHALVGGMGVTPISAESGSAGILEALAQGATVGMAVDIAGKTPVTWVGRNVIGSFGAARLAFETNSQVVVSTYHKDPKAVARIQLSEIIEPRNFPDAYALLVEILRRHEEAVLAWPEACDRPMQHWFYADDEEKEVFGDPLVIPRPV